MAISGLLVMLVVAYIVHVLSGEPKIEVDYIAKCNERLKPEGFDESLNSLQYYELAKSSFVKMPDELLNWASGQKAVITPEISALAKQSLAENEKSIDYLIRASELPYYYYYELKVDENNQLEDRPGVLVYVDIVRLLYVKGVLALEQGDDKKALAVVIALDNISRHFQCRAGSIIEQMVGMIVKRHAGSLIREILQKNNLSDQQLLAVQKVVNKMCRDYPGFNMDSEFIWNEYVFQTMFVGKPNDRGRLSWQACKRAGETDLLSFTQCLWGPTRKEIKDWQNQWHDISNQMFSCTPWELKHTNYPLMQKMEKLGDCPGYYSKRNLYPHCEKNYVTKMKTESLQIVIAAKLFLLQHGILPESQAEMVEASLLDSVVMDPYSDKELIYQRRGDDFVVYSLGNNFIDNRGLGDDIICWPEAGRSK